MGKRLISIEYTLHVMFHSILLTCLCCTVEWVSVCLLENRNQTPAEQQLSAFELEVHPAFQSSSRSYQLQPWGTRIIWDSSQVFQKHKPLAKHNLWQPMSSVLQYWSISSCVINHFFHDKNFKHLFCVTKAMIFSTIH